MYNFNILKRNECIIKIKSIYENIFDKSFKFNKLNLTDLSDLSNISNNSTIHISTSPLSNHLEKIAHEDVTSNSKSRKKIKGGKKKTLKFKFFKKK